MSLDHRPAAVFVDTCILLNYIYGRWEGDKVSALLEDERIEHVASKSVTEEFETVCERRDEIYPDILDYLIETEGDVEDYDSDERDVRVQGNDRRHVRTIQETLAQLGDRREVQTRVRRFVRQLDVHVENVRETLLDTVVEQNPYIGLQFSLADVISNEDDVKVVCDAAYWRSERDGSGPLVTLDSGDIVDNREAIKDKLIAEQDDTWRLEIVLPTDVPLETEDATPEQGD